MLRFLIVALLAIMLAASAPHLPAFAAAAAAAAATTSASLRKRLRYRELKERGVVNNWVTLQNWIRDRGFPPGSMTGPNTRTWTEDEVEEWLASRPTAPKPAIPLVKGKRGRPRKQRQADATETNTTTA